MNQELQENIKQKSEYQLKAVLNALPHSLVLIDKNLCISNYNDLFATVYQKYLGRSPQIGTVITNAFEFSKWERCRVILDQAFEGKKIDDSTYIDILNESIHLAYQMYPVYDERQEIVEIGITFHKIPKESENSQVSVSAQSIGEMLRHQENLCLLFDHLQDAIWSIDSSYCLVAFNIRFRDLYYELNHQLVQNGKNMIQDEENQKIHHFWKDLYDQVLAGEVVSTIYPVHNQEKYLFFELKSSPIKDSEANIRGATIIARDITKQILGEERIKQNLAYQQAILNSGKNAIWAVDENLKLLFFNHTIFKFIKKATGKSMKILTPVEKYFVNRPGEAESIKNIYRQALKGELVTCQSKVNWDNHILWAEFEFSPITLHAKTVGVVVNARDITKKKQNEALLAEAYQIARLGDWVLEVEKKKITWSPNFYELLGFEGESLQTDLDFFLSRIHPDHIAEFERILQESITEAKGFTICHQILIPRDQKEIFVKCIAKPFTNEQGKVFKIVGTIQDITESQNAELQIKSQKEFLESLIENLPIGVFAKDITQDFRYSIWNRKMENIFEMDRTQVIGKTDFEVEDNPEIAQHYRNTDNQVVQTKQLVHTSNEIIHKDSGDLIANIIKLVIPDAYGKPRYLLGMVEDITAHKIYENALKEAKDKAEQATQSKSDFLSMVSHEIRTPLNAVIGLSNLLLDETPLSSQVDKLEALKFSAENLLALINDILDYNKIEAGKIEFEEIEFDLKEVCGNLRKSLELQAKEKGLRLKLIYDEDIPPLLMGDTVRLSQVLYNLLSNALKFTHKGSVKLIVELVTESAESVEISFSVVDTGIGIPLEKQEIIFEQFAQSSPDITRKYGGTGLGLAITKRLLTLQNSQIHLKSTPGEGSNFYFNLVFRKSKNKATQSPGNKQIAYRNDQLKGLRVLVAEDNAINRFVIKNYLEKWGIFTDFAENGHIAIELIFNRHYDIVLMDLEMPELGGIDAAEIIRQHKNPKFKKLPIIALTASALSQVQKEVIQSGMNDYVSKPFNPSALYHKLLKFVPNHNPDNYPPPIEITSNEPEDTSEQEMINLSSLDRYNSTDENFKAKFLLLLKEEMQKFMHGYREALLNHNTSQLSAISHKIAPNLKLIHFKKLIQEIEKGKKLLKNSPHDSNAIQESIRNIEQLTASFHQYVEDYLN
ncbi:MAG: PAS domain S-box protein [Microscillaceae bacterium]|nr:PAS domain S-box protein [Microscillaceae bacterium]